MIKAKNGRLKLKGDEMELLTELKVTIQCMVKAFRNDMTNEEAWKRVDWAINAAKMSKKEIEKDVLKMIKEILEKDTEEGESSEQEEGL